MDIIFLRNKKNKTKKILKKQFGILIYFIIARIFTLDKI